MYTRQAEWGRILNGPYYSDDRATLYGGDALACRCGHPACPAAASWVPREGQARVIHLAALRAYLRDEREAVA